MLILSQKDLEQNPTIYQEIAEKLSEDGIVCFPSGSSYRLATRMMSEKAVIHFLQIKKRTRKAPVLIFVPDQKHLLDIVSEVPQGARRLMEVFWPGPLTLQFHLNEELPRKVYKNLSGYGKVGVRIPKEPIANKIVQTFGEPLLISSANIANKKGAHSEAQIRKNFGRWIDVLISQGDLRSEGSSTVMDVTSNPPKIKRKGLIDDKQALSVWNAELPNHLVPSPAS